MTFRFSFAISVMSVIFAGAHSEDASAEQVGQFGQWRVFVEERPAPKTCWMVADVPASFSGTRDSYLSVAREDGKRPYVTLYSGTKKFEKSAGILLLIEDTPYRLRTLDGQNFYPENTLRDGQVIDRVRDLERKSTKPQPVIHLSQKNKGQVAISIDGFAKALARVTTDCA